MKAPFSIVCLSSQDWDVGLPTNRQQIMLRAARRGHDVVFFETGNFLGKHLWRLLRGRTRRSLVRRLSGGEQVAPGITVRKALNIAPWAQRYRWAAELNGRLMGALVRRAADGLPAPVVLWVYDPCAARITGRCREAFAVYDCVDDYAEQVGPDRRRRALVAEADEDAAARSRLVFATTKPLFDRQSRRNPRAYLVPNAGDYDRFAPAGEGSFAAPEVGELPHPVLGFVGNIVPGKVDLELLDAVAAARPHWTILLVGPAAREWLKRVEALGRKPNVRWLGARPYDEVPRYVAAFDVGLVPYVANDYTRSCFPLKVFEYLAAAKPVVASGVPEVAGMEPDVVLAEGAGSFIRAVEGALRPAAEADLRRRRALAAANSWEKRAERLLELVSAELAA